MYAYEQIKKIASDIDTMNIHQHKKIFYFLRKYTDKFTENQNGIFLNLSEMSPNVLQHLEYYIYNELPKEENLHCEDDPTLSTVPSFPTANAKDITTYHDDSVVMDTELVTEKNTNTPDHEFTSEELEFMKKYSSNVS
jgi:hypothetical protein